MTGWETILPFINPLEPYILDPDVSEIMVNGATQVFIEKNGQLCPVQVALTEKMLERALVNIARSIGDDISTEKPLLDARLPDGSRIAAVLPPCSLNGITIAIRKFQSKVHTAEELVRIGTIRPEAMAALQAAVEQRQNILVAGAAGTGKTTLLNAFASFIAEDQRIVVIEDTAEIQIERPNVVRLVARAQQPNFPEVSIRELLRRTLRLRPDRIIVGEIRGAEAFDLLQAMNTGHSGTLSTIHANSCVEALSRLAICVLQSDVNLPYPAINRSVGESLGIVVHLARQQSGKRIVDEMIRIRGYDHRADWYDLETLFDSCRTLPSSGIGDESKGT
jgi:pilus assembly protein CpaF